MYVLSTCLGVKIPASTLEMYLDKHNIKCARGLLKQDKLDVVSADIARTLVQWLSYGGRNVDEDPDVELDGIDMVLGEIGEESESEEEFGDDDDDNDNDNDDDDDDDDDDSDGDSNFEDEDEGDDDGDAGDAEVDIGDVLHVTKSAFF